VTKKINILTLVLLGKKILNETKNHNPPREAQFFFPEFNIRLYDKNSESHFFFPPPPKSEYFFQQHWESEYFFRKKP
jgi:hypothetical protein